MIEPHFQTAVFEALASVAGGRIYDYAPQLENNEEQVFPYVTFGAMIVTTRDGSGRNLRGFDISLRLHSYARSGLVARQTQAAIYEALHGQDLGMTNFPTVFMTRNDTDVTNRPDKISHGICEYVSRFNWTPWLFNDAGILIPEGRILAGEII